MKCEEADSEEADSEEADSDEVKAFIRVYSKYGSGNAVVGAVGRIQGPCHCLLHKRIIFVGGAIYASWTK